MQKAALDYRENGPSPFEENADSNAPLRLFRGGKSGTPSHSESLSLIEVQRAVRDWVTDGQYQRLSSNTIYQRRYVSGKLLWFLEHEKCAGCGTSELRRFMLHLISGHESPQGRFGNPRLNKPLSSCTLTDYHKVLCVFAAWLMEEGITQTNLMARVSRPKHNASQVQPFTGDQIAALLRAASRSDFPRRDEAIVLFLLDTGVRASELCALRMSELDVPGRQAIVTGKGNKTRTVHFERTTARALNAYFRDNKAGPSSPVFCSCRGKNAGEPLTRSGLLQLMERLGRSARLQAVRCSPHTFRHTFAVSFLRAGGNVFTLQQLLGHSTLQMTTKYVRFAEADLENQHRQFSPVEHLTRQRKQKE